MLRLIKDQVMSDQVRGSQFILCQEMESSGKVRSDHVKSCHGSLDKVCSGQDHVRSGLFKSG